MACLCPGPSSCSSSNARALKHGGAERACRPGGMCGGRHVRGGAARPAKRGAGTAAGGPVEGLWWVAGSVKNRHRARFPWSFGKAKCRAGMWGTPAPVPSCQPPYSLSFPPCRGVCGREAAAVGAMPRERSDTRLPPAVWAVPAAQPDQVRSGASGSFVRRNIAALIAQESPQHVQHNLPSSAPVQRCHYPGHDPQLARRRRPHAQRVLQEPVAEAVRGGCYHSTASSGGGSSGRGWRRRHGGRASRACGDARQPLSV